MRNLWIFVLATWASMKDNAIQGMSKGILQHQGEYPEECWNQDAALFLTAHNVKSYWSKVVELDSPFHITVKGFGLSVGGGGYLIFCSSLKSPSLLTRSKAALYIYSGADTRRTPCRQWTTQHESHITFQVLLCQLLQPGEKDSGNEFADNAQERDTPVLYSVMMFASPEAHSPPANIWWSCGAVGQQESKDRASANWGNAIISWGFARLQLFDGVYQLVHSWFSIK